MGVPLDFAYLLEGVSVLVHHSLVIEGDLPLFELSEIHEQGFFHDFVFAGHDSRIGIIHPDSPIMTEVNRRAL